LENYNVFAGAFVDRIGERRKDAAWLTAALRGEHCCFVPVWGDRCLVPTSKRCLACLSLVATLAPPFHPIRIA